MAVEAVVFLLLRKVKSLLLEESQTFKKFKNDVEKIVIKLEEICSILNHTKYQLQSNILLRDRVIQCLGIVYRVEDALESFAVSQTHLKRMGFIKKFNFVLANEFKLCREVPEETDNSEYANRLISKIRGFSEEIQDWEDGMPALATTMRHLQISQTDDLPNPWEEMYAKEEETIFKKDAEKLVEQLTSNRKPLQIISVFGEAGIGKAALVKTVSTKLEVKNKFECHATVFVHPKWSSRNLIMAIMQQVTFMKGKEKLGDEDLIGRLHAFLKGQKYLIVINDIINLDLLNKLRGALPDAYNGSRVVITTADVEAASFADASSRFCFRPLDMEDGLKLFSKKVWGSTGSPFSMETMEDLKFKIAESCRGTPLRIAMLAGLLITRKMDYEDWSSVFQQQDFATRSPSFDILAFCYNDLPLHLKTCFLYLGLFQKGFEIPVRRLIWLWLAEGFVEPSEGIILEDIVYGYLEELVFRNMVEITERRSDQSPKKCKMIGPLHDIFLPRAVEMGFFHVHHHRNPDVAKQPHSGHFRVVEFTNIKSYHSSKSFNQNLRSYISFNIQKGNMHAEVGIFLNKIIGTRGFGLLKVLDLEGVNRPWLPENLEKLYHLRYLGLRWTFLSTLPSSVVNLHYLETLDIKHTHITTLPSSIWNMRRLRYIYLNGAPLDINVQSKKRQRGPSRLHTLWGLFLDEKIAKKIGFTLSRLTNLSKLNLTMQSSSSTTTATHPSSYEEISLWISLLSSLRSLRLISKDNMGQASELIVKPFSRLENLSQLYLLGHLRKSISWFQIPRGLKVLTLSISKLHEDPMPTLSELPNLIVLRLLAASYTGEEMHFPTNGFISLRVLKLWKLENLKRLTVDEGTMQNLHTLEIRCCQELEELPITLLHIHSFHHLILTNMPESFASDVQKNKKLHTKVVKN